MNNFRLLGKYKNGNVDTTIFSDGTLIRETQDDEFRFDFASNMDVKICDRCSMGCKFCHEGSTPDGKLADIMNEKFFDTLHPYQEIAIGGGNVLEHPDLVDFLVKLKEKKVIANVTVNQMHFMMQENFELLKILVDNELIYGIGVSLVNPTDEFIQRLKLFPNSVVHVINGVLSKNDLDALMDNDIKMLVLGYKNLRRGSDYLMEHLDGIATKQQMLYDELPNILNRFKVISFDNLALEQLDAKRLVTKEEWDEFYGGEDGTCTYYIDMVNRKFAQMSTAPLDERYDLLDNVDDMFNFIRNKMSDNL